MLWIVVAVVGLIVIGIGLVITIHGSRPRGFARQLASIQMISLLALRNKYPDSDPEDLYPLAVSTRNGYDVLTGKLIVEEAKRRAAAVGVKFGFHWVVAELAIFEFRRLAGEPTEHQIREILTGVMSVVPERF